MASTYIDRAPQRLQSGTSPSEKWLNQCRKCSPSPKSEGAVRLEPNKVVVAGRPVGLQMWETILNSVLGTPSTEIRIVPVLLRQILTDAAFRAHRRWAPL